MPTGKPMTRSVSVSVVLLVVGELNLALNLEAVERVIRAVEIGPLPDAPRGVLGVINLQGRVIPVFDLRVRFGLPAREVRSSDYLVIARMHSRAVALPVDTVEGVVPAAEVQLIESSEILPEMECISGVIKLEGDLIFVHDLEKFLSNDDYEALQAALSA
jgi:purine-binding chemotaxis protein CheW